MDPHDKSSTSAATDTNWDQEDTYWRGNYQDRPYVGTNRNYDSWRPAYRYGWESANRYSGKNWSDVETDLRSGWDRYETPRRCPHDLRAGEGYRPRRLGSHRTLAWGAVIFLSAAMDFSALNSW